jgi:hypothetical protein
LEEEMGSPSVSLSYGARREALARYCQLNATLGLFSLESGEEKAFLESFFAKNHQKTTKKSSFPSKSSSNSPSS